MPHASTRLLAFFMLCDLDYFVEVNFPKGPNINTFYMSIAQFIDHTLLKPSTSLAEIEKLCNESKEYGFAAVCVPPYYVKDAAQVLAGSKVGVATVIGFPFGYSHYEAKAEELRQALHDGANEIDM